jgi:hypothetical protein
MSKSKSKIRVKDVVLGISFLALTTCSPGNEISKRRVSTDSRGDFTTRMEDLEKAEIVRWTNHAMSVPRSHPPITANLLAMIAVAMHDAGVLAGGWQQETYLKNVNQDNGKLPVILASATAAGKVLQYVNPAMTSLYNSDLAALRGFVLENYRSDYSEKSVVRAVEIGILIAEMVIDQRRTDLKGATPDAMRVAVGVSQPERVPGVWVKEDASSARLSLPNWGKVLPWVLISGSQFRPVPPSVYGSPSYLDQVLSVASKGGVTSQRSDQENEIIRTWSEVPRPDSVQPPVRWFQVARGMSSYCSLSSQDSLRLLALSAVAMADSGIAAYEAKFYYKRWRPLRAVEKILKDQTITPIAIEADWTPFLGDDQSSPSYPSDAAAYAGSASEIIGLFFQNGDSQAINEITASWGGDGGYSGVANAAELAAMAELLGGQIYPEDAFGGLDLGRRVGRNTYRSIVRRFDEARRIVECEK